MKKLLREAGRDNVLVGSAALHADEIGSDIHRGARRKLSEKGVPFEPRAAWLLTAEKASGYDYLVGCDARNLEDARRIVRPEDRGKIRSLLSFAGLDRDIADPWYTGDFDATYDDVLLGCTALLGELESAPGV